MAFRQKYLSFSFHFLEINTERVKIGEKVRSVSFFYGSYPNRHLHFLRKSKFICPVWGRLYWCNAPGFHWLSCMDPGGIPLTPMPQPFNKLALPFVWLPPMSWRSVMKVVYQPNGTIFLQNTVTKQACKKQLMLLKSRGIKPIAWYRHQSPLRLCQLGGFLPIPHFSNNNTAICRNDDIFFLRVPPGAGISQRGANDTGEGYCSCSSTWITQTIRCIQRSKTGWTGWRTPLVSKAGASDFVKGV